MAVIVATAVVAYLPTWDLAFLDPEDWYHLILVRQVSRHGLGSALADAWAYLRGHPGMFIRTAQFAIWYGEDTLFRGWEPGYRLVSVGLHVATALLVGRTAVRAGLPSTAAWIASLAFVVNPASRALVRDPTGLCELLLGITYVAALLAWLPVAAPPDRRPAAGVGWRYAVLGVLILTRDLSFTFPFVLGALAFGRALDAAPHAARAIRGAIAHAVRVAAPALVVPLVQGALMVGELVLDPTSGRPRPAHPLGEFGQFAEGLGLTRIAAAFLRDLPRNVVFPIWDKDPEAHLASWAVVAAAIWLILGLRAARRHHGATLAAAAWIAAPMALIFPFTTWQGPDNGHLLYLSTAGLALFLASVWAALPRGSARTMSSALLAVVFATGVAFHLGRAPAERAASEEATDARTWIARLDTSEPGGRPIVLVGGTDAGTDRWKSAVLAAYATGGTWRQRYLTVPELWWDGDATSTARSSLTIAGFDAAGRPVRWRPGERLAITGLHVGEAPPDGCLPLSDGVGATVPVVCARERASTYRSLREVLLTM